MEEDKKPKFKVLLYLTVIFCNFSSVTVGVALTWTSPVLPKLNSTNPDENPLGRKISVIEESWIGSSLAVGAITGPVFGSFISEKIGRKYTLIVNVGVVHCLSYLTLAFSKVTYLFYVGRFFGGFGIGNILTVLPMYLGEISEKQNRGKIISSMNLMLCFGQLYSFSIGPFVSVMMFSLLCTIIPGLFIIVFSFFPESPFYLLQKERQKAAEKSLMFLRNGTAEEVQEELKMISQNIEDQKTNQLTFKHVFKSKGLRKALIICLVLVSIQQFSGIAPFQFYITVICKRISKSLPADIWVIMVGCVQLLAGFVAPALVDKVGRKVLLIVSAFGMFVANFFIGLSFYLKDEYDMVWLSITSLVVYIVMFNIGFGPLPWTVLGEVFPSTVKSVFGIVATVTWSFSFLLSNIFPILTELFNDQTLFWSFSLFCFLGCFFVYFYVIETKGKTFEEIQEILKE